MFKKPENGYFALALICAVCLFAIALVSWSIPYSKGYQRADQDHQSAYSSHDTAEEHERECSGRATIQEALSCYRNAYNADREQERAEEDLDAQREMANWAEGMLWATVAVGSITAAVTALGVWYVAQTLNATSATLEAANQANQIMRDEQRPWVTLRRDVECDFFDRGWGCSLAWNHNFENLGKSPAYGIRLRVKAVKRTGLMGMREELEAVVTEELHKRSGIDEVILFPGEMTEYWKYYSESGLSYTRDKTVPDGDIPILFVVLTYQLGLGENHKVGVEGRVMAIEERRNFHGPFGHKMLEYGQLKIIR